LAILHAEFEGEGVADKHLRTRLAALYAAYESGDLEAALAAFDERADFISYVPVAIFPYLGHQAGKRAIGAMMHAVRAQFEFISYKPAFMVIERASAAAIVEVRVKQRTTGRTINVNLAHFIRFREGRIIEFREFTDSFDAVQQVLGHEIDVAKL
jgi:ketosteroid isomerase-like protein